MSKGKPQPDPELPGDTPPDGDAADGNDGNAVDVRMADVLRGSTPGADLRKALQNDESDDANDLLSRLNALEFVQQVVGGEMELPDRIGGYDIKGLLGRGGMGTVYLGWQQDLEREVALKVLSQTYTADPTMRKRFRAEARATAALHHRHIVPIYDYGESQGMLFFAMERVEGMSLDKHIMSARRVDRKPMDPLDAARRFAGVADALGLAHRRRLLHRDVKPGNILVGQDGTLALTDFGLAKALDHASIQLTSKGGGGFLGTLHYSSPEQALGRELTPASDLYSLGVTMFEAITGQLPLSGKTTEALLQSILHGVPRRLRDHVHKPPRDLEAVLDKLLARESDDRYQDGEALSRDLLRIADGEPVHIRRLPLLVRLWRRARKNPVLTGALAAVMVLVVATLVLIGVLSREKGRGRESRYQNSLVAIAKDVGRELGPPWGPVPLLEALTGMPVVDVPASGNILSRMADAQSQMPDDLAVVDMQRAYVEDPVPEASAYLQTGRGFEALELYDVQIGEAIALRTAGNLAVEIGLYRLYLARGVANLTASVARPNDARTDLALASYLRPGAVFPVALLDVLDVVQSSNVALAVERLRSKLAEAARERVQTVALLLWVAAGHRPPIGANMMEFGLGYDRRVPIHRLAMELLETEPEDCVGFGEPTGLAARFADFGRRAFKELGDPTALRDLAGQTADAIQKSAHPETELQGWNYMLQLLTRPNQRGPLVGGEQQPLPAIMQLAAWRALVMLPPNPSFAQLLLPRFDEFHRRHPGLHGMLEVAAQLHMLAQSADARNWADQWVVEAKGDPRAYLCRMRVALRDGHTAAAQDDAIIAVQNALDPVESLTQIFAVLLLAKEQADAAQLGAIQQLQVRFEQVLQDITGAGGGR